MANLPMAWAQSSAAASSRAAARKLGEDGIDAYLAGQMPLAVEKLEKAFTLFPTSSLGLWSARALVRSGRWVEAAERYREGLRASEGVGDPATQKEARRETEVELDALQRRIPSLTLELNGAKSSEVTVTIDAVVIPSAMLGEPWPSDPGTHQVVVTRRKERRELKVVLAEGERKRASIGFDRVEEPSSQKTVDAKPPLATKVETTPVKAAVAEAPAPKVEPPPPPKGLVWHSDRQRGLQWSGPTDGSSQLVIANSNACPSADGKWFTYISTSQDANQGTPISELIVVDIATKKKLYHARIIGFLAAPRPSPRERHLVLAQFKADDDAKEPWQYLLYDARKNKVLWKQPAVDILDWMPDGSIVSVSTTGRINYGAAGAPQLSLPAGHFVRSFSMNRQRTKVALQLARVDKPDEHDVWVANADGTGLSRLTQTTFGGAPVWSPDGAYVAFGLEVDANASQRAKQSDACQIYYKSVTTPDAQVQIRLAQSTAARCSVLAWTN